MVKDEMYETNRQAPMLDQLNGKSGTGLATYMPRRSDGNVVK